MSKLICHCGALIELSEVPSANAYVLIQEKGLLDLQNRLILLYEQQVSSQDFKKAIRLDLLGFKNEHLMEVHLCHTCGRLWIFKIPGSSEATLLYQLEEGTVSDLGNQAEE